MGLKPLMQRPQRRAAGADLVGQGRQAQGHALAGIALGLAVERLMLAVLLEQDHCQQAGAGPAARHDVERRRRLIDALAVAARELLPHMLDHLPLAGNHLQRLGDVLAQLGQAPAAAARTGRRAGHDHPLARQMLGEWLARRPPAGEGCHTGGLRCRPLCRQLVLGRRGLKVFQLQLELIEQAGTVLRALTELRPLQLLDLQLQMGDQCMVVARSGPQRGRFRCRRRQLGLARQQQPLQARRIIRQGIHRGHRHQENHKAGRL
jgi:hypothetical protein